MICIGFGTNEKWTSKLIRWATRSEWSHVWIDYPSEHWGGRWTAHSWKDGIVKEPCERTVKNYPKSCFFEVRGFDITLGMKESRSLLGRGYDYKVIWNAVLLVIHRATKWKWLWKIVSRDINRLTCSEFVSTVLKRAELPEASALLEPEFVTVSDLFELCESSDIFELSGVMRGDRT